MNPAFRSTNRALIHILMPSRIGFRLKKLSHRQSSVSRTIFNLGIRTSRTLFASRPHMTHAIAAAAASNFIISFPHSGIKRRTLSRSLEISFLSSHSTTRHDETLKGASREGSRRERESVALSLYAQFSSICVLQVNRPLNPIRRRRPFQP